MEMQNSKQMSDDYKEAQNKHGDTQEHYSSQHREAQRQLMDK